MARIHPTSSQKSSFPPASVSAWGRLTERQWKRLAGTTSIHSAVVMGRRTIGVYGRPGQGVPQRHGSKPFCISQAWWLISERRKATALKQTGNHSSALSKLLKEVEQFSQVDPIRPIRTLIALFARCRGMGRQCELIIDHDFGGGSNLFRQTLVRDLVAQSAPLVLITWSDKDSTIKVTVQGGMSHVPAIELGRCARVGKAGTFRTNHH